MQIASRSLLIPMAVLCAGVLIVPSAKAAAIYTTDITGTTVNANLFASRTDAYMDGGPQGGGSGLPDGLYYFQVTNPSGSIVLSNDAISCRTLDVSAGVVIGAHTSGNPCAHANGNFNPANGTTAVQLWPFSYTPNKGGEYKVWVSMDPTDRKSVV